MQKSALLLTIIAVTLVSATGGFYAYKTLQELKPPPETTSSGNARSEEEPPPSPLVERVQAPKQDDKKMQTPVPTQKKQVPPSTPKETPMPPVLTPTPTPVPVPPPIPSTTKIPIFFLEDDGSLIVDGGIIFNAIGKKFFTNHADQYDFIHVFTAGYPSIQTTDVFVRVRPNPAKGLGSVDSENPNPNYFGANQNGKLMGFSYIGLNLDSNQIQLFPEDLAFRALLEETAHNWGVFIGNQYGEGGLEVREAGPHWWRGLQTMRDFDGMREAGPWKDNGDGTFSLPVNHCTVGSRTRSYSPFMLYLMGLADPQEITQPFLLIKSSELQADSCKEIVRGTAQKITINDLINAAGKARTIATVNSQKDFQMAFVVIYPKGAVISNQATSNVNWIAQNLPIKWAGATSCRSSLNGAVIPSQTCAATIFPK